MCVFVCLGLGFLDVRTDLMMSSQTFPTHALKFNIFTSNGTQILLLRDTCMYLIAVVNEKKSGGKQRHVTTAGYKHYFVVLWPLELISFRFDFL